MSRAIHLGLDWGTSATKMVLRDMEAIGAVDGRAYLLRTPAGSERHPSLVVLHEGKLWFGIDAEQRVNDAQRVWHDLKVQFAVQGRADEPAVDELTVRDLSVLFLTHMLNLARHRAARLPDGADAQLGFKLGVPAAELTTFRGQRAYLDLARAARRLSVVEATEVNGLTPVQLRPLLDQAWAQGARRHAVPLTEDVITTWLEAEAASEMVWPLRSPAIPEGVYTAVDIGAGTTNASFFRIHTGHVGGRAVSKGRLTFYGAACAPPGLNRLIAVARQLEVEGREILAHRGHEESMASANGVGPVLGEFRKVWIKAKQDAWRSNPGQRAWDDLGLILVGGGKKVRAVQRLFESRPPIQYLQGYRAMPDLGCPDDLYELPPSAGTTNRRFAGDATFLLTAYGLSFPEMPTIDLPDGRHFRRNQRTRPAQEAQELGYDER